jgi:ATP-dependent 26S proteasome regulatory subunit
MYSFVDKDQLKLGSTVLLNRLNHSIVGVLTGDNDPKISSMILEKAPKVCYILLDYLIEF